MASDLDLKNVKEFKKEKKKNKFKNYINKRIILTFLRTIKNEK